MISDEASACPSKEENSSERELREKLQKAEEVALAAARKHRAEKVKGSSAQEEDAGKVAPGLGSSEAEDSSEPKAEAEDADSSSSSSSSSASSASSATSDSSDSEHESEDDSASSSSSSSSSDSDSDSDLEDIVLDKTAYGAAANVECAKDGTLSFAPVVFPLWRSWPLYNIREGDEADALVESDDSEMEECAEAALEPEPEDQKEKLEMNVLSRDTAIFKSQSMEKNPISAKLEGTASSEDKGKGIGDPTMSKQTAVQSLVDHFEKLETRAVDHFEKLETRAARREQILTKLDEYIQPVQEEVEVEPPSGGTATSTLTADVAHAEELPVLEVDMLDCKTDLDPASPKDPDPASPGNESSSQPELTSGMPSSEHADLQLSTENVTVTGLSTSLPNMPLRSSGSSFSDACMRISGQSLVGQIQELEAKAHNVLSKLDVYLQRAHGQQNHLSGQIHMQINVGERFQSADPATSSIDVRRPASTDSRRPSLVASAEEQNLMNSLRRPSSTDSRRPSLASAEEQSLISTLRTGISVDPRQRQVSSEDIAIEGVTTTETCSDAQSKADTDLSKSEYSSYSSLLPPHRRASGEISQAQRRMLTFTPMHKGPLREGPKRDSRPAASWVAPPSKPLLPNYSGSASFNPRPGGSFNAQPAAGAHPSTRSWNSVSVPQRMVSTPSGGASSSTAPVSNRASISHAHPARTSPPAASVLPSRRLLPSSPPVRARSVSPPTRSRVRYPAAPVTPAVATRIVVTVQR